MRRSSISCRHHAVLYPAMMLMALFHGWCVLFVITQYNLVVAISLLFAPVLLVTVVVVAMQAIRQCSELTRNFSWWHAAWGLITLSSVVFRTRSAESIRETPVDTSAAYRIILVGIVAAVLAARLVLGKTPWLPSLFRGVMAGLGVYVSVAIASSVWSVFPLWSLYRSFEYFVDLSLVAAILVAARSTKTLRSLFDWTWILTIVFMGTVWFGVLAWPSEALIRDVGKIGIQIQGVFPVISSNSVGDLGAVLGVVALARLLCDMSRTRRVTYWLLLSSSLITLVLAQTRSALTAFLLGASAVLLCSRRIGTAVFVGWLLTVVLTLTNIDQVFWEYFRRGQTDQTFENLTGRLDWWAFGWQKFLESPLVGHGAYAGGRFVTLEAFGADMTASVHNTYLEVLLGTGMLGLVPLVLALSGIWIVLLRALRSNPQTSLEWQLALETLGVLSITTFRSFFASTFIWHPDLYFMLILTYTEFLNRGQRAKACRNSQHARPRLNCREVLLPAARSQ
jgi:hypothetical protein